MRIPAGVFPIGAILTGVSVRVTWEWGECPKAAIARAVFGPRFVVGERRGRPPRRDSAAFERGLGDSSIAGVPKRLWIGKHVRRMLESAAGKAPVNAGGPAASPSVSRSLLLIFVRSYLRQRRPRVQIAKATIAGDNVRGAFFHCAVLAIPVNIARSDV